MTIQEAMKERHMVRKYIDKPIPSDLVEKLNARIAENNQTHDLSLFLVTGNADGLGALAKIIGRGIKNYIVLAGPDSADLDERLGYCGADLILYAQTLGLNTWWVGGMYNAKGAQKNMSNVAVRINGVLAIGYGQTQGVPHKSKTAAEISNYKGVAPQWFIDGVDALLLAPTALNKQAFTVRGDGSKVSLACDSGHFAGVDLGIGKYHFEVGAGKENFVWAEDKKTELLS